MYPRHCRRPKGREEGGKAMHWLKRHDENERQAL